MTSSEFKQINKMGFGTTFPLHSFKTWGKPHLLVVILNVRGRGYLLYNLSDLFFWKSFFFLKLIGGDGEASEEHAMFSSITKIFSSHWPILAHIRILCNISKCLSRHRLNTFFHPATSTKSWGSGLSDWTFCGEGQLGEQDVNRAAWL